MKPKIFKLSEAQYNQLINEDYPFSYLGNKSSDTNHGSGVMVNAPYDSPDVDPEPTDADKISHTLSNNSWWNRHYGFNGYCL